MNTDLHPWSAILGDEALAAVRAIARSIPDVGRGLGFECRLLPGEPTVDLGLAVSRAEGQQPPLFPTGARWDRISAFFRRWSDPVSPLHTWVPFIFLEFDAASSSQAVPTPSVFVTFDWPLGQRGPDAPAQVAAEALTTLLGAPVPARAVQCFHTLPESGRVVHAGAMLGREGSGIRLSISVERVALRPYVDAIGYRNPGAIEDVTALFGPEDDRAHIELDVGETIGETTGVIFAPRDEPGWLALFDRLSDAGLCAAAKRQALLAWPGVFEGTLPGRDAPCLLRRALSHVKLSHRPDAALAAKAYLTVMPA